MYIDQGFMQEAVNGGYRRLAGGATSNDEMFYDCATEKSQDNVEVIFPDLQQSFNINDVISNIKNPKEFKAMLKELINTADVLYHSYNRAYKKNKQKFKNYSAKSKLTCEYCRRENQRKRQKIQNYCSQKDRGDTNRCGIVNRTLDNNDPSEIVKSNVIQNLVNHQTTKGHETRNEIEENVPQVPQRIVNLSCLVPSNFCQTLEEPFAEESLKEDYFMIPKIDIKDQSSQTINQQNCEKCLVNKVQSMQTLNPKHTIDYPINDFNKTSTSFGNQTSSKLPKIHNETLAMSPINVTIPLTIQIDSQNYSSRFIETEIVLDTLGDREHTHTQNESQPRNIEESYLLLSQAAAKSNLNKVVSTTQSESKSIKSGCNHINSDIFYSCLSDSSVKETFPEQIVKNFIIENLSAQPTVEKLPAPPTLPPHNIILKSAKEKKPSTELPESDESKKFQLLLAELLNEVVDTLERVTTEEALTYFRELQLNILHFEFKSHKKSKTDSNEQNLPLNDQLTVKTEKPIMPLDHKTSIKKEAELPEVSIKPRTSLSFLQIEAKQSLTPSERPIYCQPTRESVAEFKSQKSEIIQTDSLSLTTLRHFKRNDLRIEIKERLNELLNPKNLNSLNLYDAEERDDILLYLYRLLHPKTAATLPRDKCRENVLKDLKNILQPISQTPQVSLASSKTSLNSNNSQKCLLQSIRYLLYPKQKIPALKKKYSKDIKDKILKDFQTILTPTNLKAAETNELRENILNDLRFMLETGKEKTSAERSLSPFMLKQEVSESLKVEPISSHEITNGVTADLKHMIDLAQTPKFHLETTNHPAMLTSQATTSQQPTASHHPTTSHQASYRYVPPPPSPEDDESDN